MKTITVANVEEYLASRNVPITLTTMEMDFLVMDKPGKKQRLVETLNKLRDQRKVFKARGPSQASLLLGDIFIPLLGRDSISDYYIHQNTLPLLPPLIRQSFEKDGQ